MPARVGYTKGLPMGGDLSAAPAGKSPTFLVAALKDPIRANLDRIQIVKGWLDKGGQDPGESLRRSLERRSQTGRRRESSVGWEHRGRAKRDLHQFDRRHRTNQSLERPGIFDRHCVHSITCA